MVAKETQPLQITPFFIPVISQVTHQETITVNGQVETDKFISHTRSNFDQIQRLYLLFDPEVIVSPQQPWFDSTNISNLSLVTVPLSAALFEVLKTDDLIDVPPVLAREAALTNDDEEENDVYLFFTKSKLENFLLKWELVADQVFGNLHAQNKLGFIFFLEQLTNELHDILFDSQNTPQFGVKLAHNDRLMSIRNEQLTHQCERLSDFLVDEVLTIPAEVRYQGALAHEHSHARKFSRGLFYFYYYLPLFRETPLVTRLYEQTKMFEEMEAARQEIIAGATYEEQVQLLFLKLSTMLSDFRTDSDDRYQKSLFQKEVEKIYNKGAKAAIESPYTTSYIVLLFMDIFLAKFNRANENNLASIFSLDPLLDTSKPKDEAILELAEHTIQRIDRAIADPSQLLSLLRSPECERWIDWHFQAQLGKFIQQLNKKLSKFAPS